MAKKYDVVAVTGKYTGNDGQEKNRYLNIGSVISTKNGFMLKLESVPVGWDGWAYLNDPKPRDGKEAPRAAPRATQRQADPIDDMDSDIPF